jgi:hypothetical protein
MTTAPCINTRIIVLCFKLLYRHLYHLTHTLAIHSCHSAPCHSAPQLHLVSDAMTGSLCAAVCEVLAVTHYQKQRMMESIDRVRLYQKF